MPDTPVAVPEAAGAGPDLEVDPTLEVRTPMPIYDPQNHTERSWANARAQYQSTEVSEPSAAAQTTLEHEISLRNGDHHIEEDMNITLADARREMTVESAVDEEIGQNVTRAPGDTIRPSLNA